MVSTDGDVKTKSTSQVSIGFTEFTSHLQLGYANLLTIFFFPYEYLKLQYLNNYLYIEHHGRNKSALKFKLFLC